MPKILWSDFLRYIGRNWRQGEHVSIIGTTGSGKSVLELQLLTARQYVVLFLTKGKDSTLTKYIKDNEFTVIKNWPPSGFDEKIALWPKFVNVDSFEAQRRVFQRAINGDRKTSGIFSEGGWSIGIDEVMYFTEELHLQNELRMLWTQGRSNDLSLVACTQRPRDVPQLMLNQWSHLFVFQTSDTYELKRLTEIGGRIGQQIKEIVPYLQQHDFLYVNRRTNEYYISKVSL